MERNVELVKGLFSDSLPKFLKEQATYAGGNQTVSYLHIDCDLYAGSRDAFTILTPFIKPGTIILFDELVRKLDARGNTSLSGGNGQHINGCDLPRPPVCLVTAVIGFLERVVTCCCFDAAGDSLWLMDPCWHG